MKAIWNNTVIAQSDNTVIVDNNHYFPADSIFQEYFAPSEKTTMCPWKGIANYYNIGVDGKENLNSAWFYPEPKNAADHIKGYVAFWRGVEITE